MPAKAVGLTSAASLGREAICDSVPGRPDCLILEAAWWGVCFATASEPRASKAEINGEQNCAALAVPRGASPLRVIIK